MSAMRTLRYPLAVFIPLFPLLASAQDNETEPVVNAALAYQKAVFDAGTAYQSSRERPSGETRQRACTACDVATGYRLPLTALVAALAPDAIERLNNRLEALDVFMRAIRKGLDDSGGCKAGAVPILMGSYSGYAQITTSPPTGGSSGTLPSSPGIPATTGSTSTHKVLGFVGWEGLGEERDYVLIGRAGTGAQFRPGLFRELADEMLAEESVPIVGAIDPPTAAADVSRLTQSITTNPDKLGTNVLPRLTIAEAQVVTEVASQVPGVQPQAVEQLRQAVHSAEQNRQDKFREAPRAATFGEFDEATATQAWLQALRAGSQPVDLYRQVLEGRNLDLHLSQNGKQVLVQVRPSTTIEAATNGDVRIGGALFEPQQLGSAIVRP